ncbi:uncharacterized protein [Chelonus insularis]|uniref:uncharacterized protein n=1 Tax=Chelonus insularis TaxID=460826 RepID=UPI00158D52D0|nr:uncharacterized protein LOC118068901 [Chelonus insularis]
MLKVFCIIVLMIGVTEVIGKPMIYKRNEDNVFEPVMIPVSSTVIPLPVYKVGYGYGFVSKDKKAQATYNPDGQVKLITAKKRIEKI